MGTLSLRSFVVRGSSRPRKAGRASSCCDDRATSRAALTDVGYCRKGMRGSHDHSTRSERGSGGLLERAGGSSPDGAARHARYPSGAPSRSSQLIAHIRRRVNTCSISAAAAVPRRSSSGGGWAQSANVLEVDVSEPMLGRARERAPAEVPLEFVQRTPKCIFRARTQRSPLLPLWRHVLCGPGGSHLPTCGKHCGQAVAWCSPAGVSRGKTHG